MGSLYAFGSAVCWAFAVILFKKANVDYKPFALNFFKNVLALVLFALTALALGQLNTHVHSTRDLLLIFVSGAVGVGLSDLLFLEMLDRIGASRSGLIDCLYSPLVILFAFLFFGENLTLLHAIGGFLILISVLLSTERSFENQLPTKELWIGILLGFASMFCVAIAYVMVKPTLSTYPLAWTALVRMTGGISVVAFFIPFYGKKASFKIFQPQKAWRIIVPASILATYFSMILWLGGFKYAGSHVAALLNQTSTIVIVLLATLVLKEKLTMLKIVAVILAFAGGILVLF